jgi:hypothetical protein
MVQWSNTLSTNNSTKDGTGFTFEKPIVAANTQNGTYIDYIRWRPLGTTNGTVGRVFLNNGRDTNSAANNALIAEISLPGQTWSETASLPEFTQYLRLSIPASHNVYVCLSNTVNSVTGWGWQATAVGGNYGNPPGGSVPIFVKTPKQFFSNVIITQNQTRFGTGTMTLVYKGNTDGSYVDHIRAKSAGTNIATVARFWVFNGGTQGQANNYSLFTESSLPAITNSETASQQDVPIAMKLPLPANYNVYVTLGTTVASGWSFIGVGGDY